MGKKATQHEDNEIGRVSPMPEMPDLAMGHITVCEEWRLPFPSGTGLQDGPRSRWTPKKLETLIPNRFSFTAHDNDDQTIHEIKKHPKLFFFSTDCQEQYAPFCADFGPVNLSALVHFCRTVRSRMMDKRLDNRHLVYYFTNDTESASNAAFLLAAYLMLEHNFPIEHALAPFTGLSGSPIVPFRDATFAVSTFPLTLRDCLGGLKRARELGWFDLDRFDVDEYDRMDDPDGGDMHRICPKFVAFRGPDDRARMVDEGEALHPQAYARMFKRLGVTTVVRLNGTETYDKRAFEAAGFRHCDLFFTDCTTPSEALVCTFLRECDAAQGAVAVHCLAGLGRTGTMIGAWLMRSAGFTAREAIGWLRIVRPGSVIGPQQHLLAAIEGRLRGAAFACRDDDDDKDDDKEEGASVVPTREEDTEHDASQPWTETSATMAADVEAAMRDRARAKRREGGDVSWRWEAGLAAA